MRNLEFEWASQIPDIGDDYEYADFSVCADGGGLFLFVRKDAIERAYSRHHGVGHVSLPNTSAEEQARFALVHSYDGVEIKYDLPAIDISFPLFDLLPNGEILIAGARSCWSAKGDMHLNGVIIDPVAGGIRRILLGDGIQDLFVDKNGQIWVSYFDEGVFGNLGWGDPGAEPVGASGLNCFDADGKIVWRFPGHEIADCYAMNVARNFVYVYYYTEFPLCRIDERHELKKWETELRGCSQFAVGDRFVLFTGQYDDERSTGYLCRLSDDKLSTPEKVSLSLPGGNGFARRNFVGRGAELHYCSDEGWFRFNVNEIANRSGENA